MDLMANAMVVHGEAARHLRVSAGLESMLGERGSYPSAHCHGETRQWGLAGDQLRITERIAVETAKRVFTETDIARRSVSVNALGWKAFREWGLPQDAPVLTMGRDKPTPTSPATSSKATPTSMSSTGPKRGPSHRRLSWVDRQHRHLARRWPPDPPPSSSARAAMRPLGAAEAAALPDGRVHVLDLSVPAGVASNSGNAPRPLVGIAELKPIADANAEGRRAALGDCQRIVEEASPSWGPDCSNGKWNSHCATCPRCWRSASDGFGRSVLR